MEIVNVKLSEITPYANNPRVNDEAVAAVVASIRKFGFIGAIILNKDQVIIDTLTESCDIQELRELIEEHVAATGSPKGKQILAAFKSYIPCFKKIMPRDYDRMIRAIAQLEAKGMSREQAEIEAFYASTKA